MKKLGILISGIVFLNTYDYAEAMLELTSKDLQHAGPHDNQGDSRSVNQPPLQISDSTPNEKSRPSDREIISRIEYYIAKRSLGFVNTEDIQTLILNIRNVIIESMRTGITGQDASKMTEILQKTSQVFSELLQSHSYLQGVILGENRPTEQNQYQLTVNLKNILTKLSHIDISAIEKIIQYEKQKTPGYVPDLISRIEIFIQHVNSAKQVLTELQTKVAQNVIAKIEGIPALDKLSATNTIANRRELAALREPIVESQTKLGIPKSVEISDKPDEPTARPEELSEVRDSAPEKRQTQTPSATGKTPDGTEANGNPDQPSAPTTTPEEPRKIDPLTRIEEQIPAPANVDETIKSKQSEQADESPKMSGEASQLNRPRVSKTDLEFQELDRPTQTGKQIPAHANTDNAKKADEPHKASNDPNIGSQTPTTTTGKTPITPDNADGDQSSTRTEEPIAASGNVERLDNPAELITRPEGQSKTRDRDTAPEHQELAQAIQTGEQAPTSPTASEAPNEARPNQPEVAETVPELQELGRLAQTEKQTQTSSDTDETIKSELPKRTDEPPKTPNTAGNNQSSQSQAPVIAPDPQKIDPLTRTGKEIQTSAKIDETLERPKTSDRLDTVNQSNQPQVPEPPSEAQRLDQPAQSLVTETGKTATNPDNANGDNQPSTRPKEPSAASGKIARLNNIDGLSTFIDMVEYNTSLIDKRESLWGKLKKSLNNLENLLKLCRSKDRNIDQQLSDISDVVLNYNRLASAGVKTRNGEYLETIRRERRDFLRNQIFVSVFDDLTSRLNAVKLNHKDAKVYEEANKFLKKIKDDRDRFIRTLSGREKRQIMTETIKSFDTTLDEIAKTDVTVETQKIGKTRDSTIKAIPVI